MKKWYLLMNKTDDFGNGKQELYYGSFKNFKHYVYDYQEVPAEDIPILKKYLCVLNDYYETLKELQEYLYENY